MFGHSVPVIARRKGLYWSVCWGRLQALTPAFYQSYAIECMAYVSLERLARSVTRRGVVTYTSPERRNLAALLDDLNAIAG